MHLLSEFTLEQAHLLPSGAQLLDEHGTERDGLGPRLCRAHDRSRSPFLSCAPLMKPLVKGTAGALEVDAEGITTPADQEECTGWTGYTSSPYRTGWTYRTS